MLAPQSILASVEIYQFLPNPTNESEEWIEVKNTGTEKVDISGYQLDDEKDGGSKPYTFPANTLIDPDSILKVTKLQSGIALNNSKQKDQVYADMVRLIEPNGNEVDSVVYTSTKTDQIINKFKPSLPTTVPSPTVTDYPTPSPTNMPEITPTKTPTATPHSIVLASNTEKLPTNTVTQVQKPFKISETQPVRQSILSLILEGVGVGCIGVSFLRISRKIRAYA